MGFPCQYPGANATPQTKTAVSACLSPLQPQRRHKQTCLAQPWPFMASRSTSRAAILQKIGSGLHRNSCGYLINSDLAEGVGANLGPFEARNRLIRCGSQNLPTIHPTRILGYCGLLWAIQPQDSLKLCFWPNTVILSDHTGIGIFPPETITKKAPGTMWVQFESSLVHSRVMNAGATKD